MKQFFKMAAAPASAMFALALMAMVTPASAAPGEFCRTDSSQMRSCAFSTLQQCKDSASGRGGTCDRDPFYASPSNALAYAPKHVHAKAAKKLIEQ
jgi:Protein of unknown function (DUF3551)